MKFNKIIAFLLVLATSVGLLTGCKGDGDRTDTDKNTQTEGKGTLVLN